MTAIRPTATADEILAEIGDRIRRYRLQQNRTVATLAREAGVGVRTIVRLEAGQHPTLHTVVQVLRALGRIDALDAFLPAPNASPLQLAKLAGRERSRASSPRRKSADDDRRG